MPLSNGDLKKISEAVSEALADKFAPKPKDKLDVLAIFLPLITGALIPISIYWAGQKLSRELALENDSQNKAQREISDKLARSQRDTELLQHFIKCYASKEERRLAPQFLRYMSNRDFKNDLRSALLWNITEGHLRPFKPDEPECDWKFRSEDDDWHLLGDIYFDWQREDSIAATSVWKGFIKTCSKRWVPIDGQLKQMYDFIESIYTPRPAPGTPSPQKE